MALDLTAFGIKNNTKNTGNLDLSAFGISPEVEPTPLSSFSDIIGQQDMDIKTTTPPITEEKGFARLPFGKEAREIPGGIVPAIGVSLIGGLLEAIPKVGVQLLANKKGIDAQIAGKPEEPLDLSFGELGKRLGFDSNKIKSSGQVFMEDFTKRQQENPDKFYTNFALAYLRPVLDILDSFVAGSVVTSFAKVGLRATLTDPLTQSALKKLRLTPDEALEMENLKYVFVREMSGIVGTGNEVQKINELGGMIQVLINRGTGAGIKDLNKLGEVIQKTSRAFLSDMSLVTKRPLVGLSIEDISRQIPVKIKEAGKLVEQIKQAGGDIQKAQGIFNELGKATSVSGIESLFGRLKEMTQAEELVKAQEPKVNWQVEKQKPFEFCQDCTVAGSGEDISKLVENSQDISYGDFIKVVGKDKLTEMFPQYKWKIGDESPLKMSDDYAVSFSRGVFKGEPAYYVTQSGIEYIFTNGTKLKTPTIKIPPKTKLIQETRKITDEDLKLLAQKLKGKDITQAKFEELALEFQFAEQIVEANAAKELAKYSPKQEEFAGRLREVTGKKEGGIFAERGDQLVTELGFKDSEEARMAFDAYKKQRQQLDIIKQQITELRETKAAIGKGERLMKLAQGDRRIRLRAVKDAFNLTDTELSSIRKGRDISAMSQSEFNKFIEEAENLAEKLEATGEARVSLQATIYEKDLRKWENVQKALKLPPINKMSIEQLNQLNEILSQYKDADEFLTQRQLETIGRTELKGMRTTREVLEHLAKKYNLSVSDLPNIKPHPWMYDTQLARQHPLYDLLVDKYNISYLKATGRIIELEKEVDKLIKASRKFQLVPTDKNIIKWLEAENRTGIRLTATELKAAQRMDEVFREYYDWLVKRAIDKKFISRFENKYFPHTRRGFLEAWKEDGFLRGVKEAFDQFKQEERMLTILDEKTGSILPYEKWVGFTKFRTDKLIPTQNAAKAFKTYITALEKARQFDEFIPEIMIYVHALTPKAMTPKGLKMNDALQRFIKSWINSKKGRVQKQIVTPGGKMDWALRMGVSLIRIRDLGLNVPIGIANIFGEQAGNLTMLRSSYPLGLARLATSKGRDIVKKYESFVGQSLWEKLTKASNNAGDTLLQGILGIFNVAFRRGNQVFLLGSMTNEEWTKGIISVERLAYLRKKKGKYRIVEGAESVFGKSAEAAVGGQYKKWAIPIITSTAHNAKKLSSILRNKGVKAALSSEEGAELFFSVILGSTVGLGIMGYYNGLKEKKDRNFVEDLIYKSGRDALSMIGALNPRFLASFATPRLASLIIDLGEALENIIFFEKYKTTGKLKGGQQFKQIITPLVIKQFLREKESGIFSPSIKIPAISIPLIKVPLIKVPSIKL